MPFGISGKEQVKVQLEKPLEGLRGVIETNAKTAVCSDENQYCASNKKRNAGI